VGDVERARADVELLAGQQQAAQAGLAVALAVDQRAHAGEHPLIAQQADVGLVSLAARVDVRRGLEPVARGGEQGADARRSVLVLEQVRAVETLRERIDDRHDRGSSPRVGEARPSRRPDAAPAFGLSAGRDGGPTWWSGASWGAWRPSSRASAA